MAKGAMGAVSGGIRAGGGRIGGSMSKGPSFGGGVESRGSFGPALRSPAFSSRILAAPRLEIGKPSTVLNKIGTVDGKAAVMAGGNRSPLISIPKAPETKPGVIDITNKPRNVAFQSAYDVIGAANKVVTQADQKFLEPLKPEPKSNSRFSIGSYREQHTVSNQSLRAARQNAILLPTKSEVNSVHFKPKQEFRLRSTSRARPAAIGGIYVEDKGRMVNPTKRPKAEVVKNASLVKENRVDNPSIKVSVFPKTRREVNIFPVKRTVFTSDVAKTFSVKVLSKGKTMPETSVQAKTYTVTMPENRAKTADTVFARTVVNSEVHSIQQSTEQKSVQTFPQTKTQDMAVAAAASTEQVLCNEAQKMDSVRLRLKELVNQKQQKKRENTTKQDADAVKDLKRNESRRNYLLSDVDAVLQNPGENTMEAVAKRATRLLSIKSVWSEIADTVEGSIEGLLHTLKGKFTTRYEAESLVDLAIKQNTAVAIESPVRSPRATLREYLKVIDPYKVRAVPH